jgi:hypothetical protein
VTSRSRSATEPRVLGVGLDQYAGVQAALAEGIPLEAALTQEQIAPGTWAEADRAWKEELADAPDLELRYRRLRRQAEDCLARPIAPLDDDAAAWAGLLGALAVAPDAEVTLGRLGLRMTDVARLGRAWREKAARDPKVAERLIELAGRAPPPSSVRCGAGVLRPFPWTPAPLARRAVEAPAVQRESVEVAPPSAEPLAAPPAPRPEVPSFALSPLSPAAPAAPALASQVPLASLDTLGPGPAPARPALPFGDDHSPAFLQAFASGPAREAEVRSGDTLALSTPARAAAAPSLASTLGPEEARPPAPELPFDMSGKPEEPYGLTLAQYASLWAELAVHPERAPAVLRRYGVPGDEGRKLLNEAWGRRFVKAPELRRTWMGLCARYREWLAKQGVSR